MTKTFCINHILPLNYFLRGIFETFKFTCSWLEKEIWIPNPEEEERENLIDYNDWMRSCNFCFVIHFFSATFHSSTVCFNLWPFGLSFFFPSPWIPFEHNRMKEEIVSVYSLFCLFESFFLYFLVLILSL